MKLSKGLIFLITHLTKDVELQRDIKEKIELGELTTIPTIQRYINEVSK